MFCGLALAVAIALIAYTCHKISTRHSKYFEERNLKYRGPVFTIRNLFSVFFGKSNAFLMSHNMYNACPNEPIFGLFDFVLRQYFIRDPEIFKQITIKDFDHFEDRRSFINENGDELWDNILLSLHGEKWRQMRATLSPAFTGSKMRQMFELVSECADEIVKHFTAKAQSGEKINIEMKDVFSRYTNDVIATCAFGIKADSFNEPENWFFMSGKKLLNFTGFLTSLKFFVNFAMPSVAKRLKLQLFDGTISNSFKYMILDTMATRKNNNIYRPDMINLLMQVREGSLNHQSEDKSNESTDGFATVEESEIGKTRVTRKWNDNELVAQCLIFFLAGFETSSSALSFAAYELVANPNVQQKLYEEIKKVNEQITDGKRISYEELQRMKYLDQVVSETLRKWPNGVQIDRICVKDYVYDDGDGLKFQIEKGTNLVFSIYGIHRDAKYYPNPEQFDPERFSDENKHKILPGTYVPFGIGPRNCIGSRFALMEIKAILYYLLLNFSFEPNNDTQIPLKFKCGPFAIPEKGVQLELKPRHS